MDIPITKGARIKADLMMVMVTMFWGASYLFMKMGLHSIQEFNLIALRFGIAFLIAVLVFYRRLLKIDGKTILYGFLLGSLLFLCTSVVVIGLNTTSVSNAGFLFSLAVIFVPLLVTLFSRKKPEKRMMIDVLCFDDGNWSINVKRNIAHYYWRFLVFLRRDVLCPSHHRYRESDETCGCHLHWDHTAWVCGSMGTSLFHSSLKSRNCQAPPIPWIAILGLSILCSAVGFIGQAVAQKHTTPTRTGLIFSFRTRICSILLFLFSLGRFLQLKDI